MRLSRFRIDRAPGLEKGLGEHRFEAGLNVVFGPNESGKSTLARAIQSTLWPRGRRGDAVISATSEWDDDGETWSARFDGETAWSREGRPDEGPALPPAENRSAYRLHLRDLIAGEDEDGDAFAARVRSALDGGYDLSRRVFDMRGRRHGAKEKNDLVAAENELRKIEGLRADLARRADELVRLDARREAADQARGEVVRLERVLAWLEADRKLARARDDLAHDPTPDLEGHEGDQLSRLDAAIATCDEDRAGLASELEGARRLLAELDLGGEPPGDAVLASWLEDARALVQLEQEAQTARAALAEARAAEEAARRALHATLPPATEASTPLFAPGLDDVEALAQWLELRASAAADRRVLEARRVRLESRAGDLAEAVDDRFASLEAAALGDARRLVAGALRRGPGLAGPGLGAALAGGAVAVASWRGWLSLVPQASELLVPGARAALAAVAALAGGLLGALVGRALARRRAAKGLRELGIEGAALELPPSDLLDALDAALAHRDRTADVTRELGDVQIERAELERRSPELEERRQRLIEGFGLDPGVEDLTLVTWARRLQDHERSIAELTRAESAEAAAAERFTAASALQVERVAPFAATRPVTPTEVAAAVQALQRRIEALTRTRADIQRVAERIEKIEERRDEHVRERDALLERLGLGSLDAETARARLRGWLEGLEPRRELRARVRDAEAARAEHARALEGHDALMQLDEAQVELRLERARALEREADALREEAAAVRREVENAEGENRVELALARVHEARAALEARREEIFEGVASKLLIDDVSEQIGTRHRPEVLSRATELFGLFTRHRYELEVASFGDRVRFVARATESNERKQLGQLSDGTRMQLLLAARLAFVHDGERGVRPPLVLDEALSSSDQARMTAMTDALVAEAETGRQVFYMTNDPGDVEFWRAACERAGAPPPNVVRLGEAERDAAAASWEGFEAPEPLAPVPAPDGLDARQYGAKLGVPLPDPWAELGELHLFHLLSDDLELLHRVLEEGHVERLGHFESRRRSGAAETLLGAEVVDRIGFRARVAERFFDAWRRGRGKRLRPGDLEACDALSDLFKKRLAAVAEEVGGDASVLMARIIENRDDRVKRLGRGREGLESFLYERGFLTQDEPLDDDALVTEVSAGIGEALFGLDRDEARRRLREAESLVRLWTRLLEHGGEAA